jgi:hypothetical protein
LQTWLIEEPVCRIKYFSGKFLSRLEADHDVGRFADLLKTVKTAI